MKTFYTFILFFTQTAFGQSATIKVVHTNLANQYEKFDNIIFSFNNITFSAGDTSARKLQINKNGFDKCFAVIDKDTLHFITRFKENESYTIRPGCCCAAFTLTADNHAKRGTVRFVNNTSRDLLALIAEANRKTIKAKKTSGYIFAGESAMCLFKPAFILIAEASYNDSKYDYKTDNKTNYDSLWKEREKHILTSSWFHFLHGEKLTIKYNDRTKDMSLTLDGYLTDEEYKKVW